jgi:hypothetical protein
MCLTFTFSRLCIKIEQAFGKGLWWKYQKKDWQNMLLLMKITWMNWILLEITSEQMVILM